MNSYLAVDTANEYLTVIACKEGKETVYFEPHCGMQHSVRLMDAVEKTLARAELALKDCDFFAAVTGPGSFTGIRIGISCVKGFCAALKKPAVGITSLETLAYNAEGRRIAAVPAGRGFYYVCGYDGDALFLPPVRIDEEELSRLAGQYPVYSRLPLPVPYREADPAAGLKAALQKRRPDGQPLAAFYLKKSQAEEEREKRGG